MTVPLGFSGLRAAGLALGPALSWLAPPGSTAAAAFRGMSAAHGGSLLLAGGAGAALGGSGGSGGSSGNGSGGGSGGGGAGGDGSKRDGGRRGGITSRACGRGASLGSGAGVGGLGDDTACSAVGTSGLRLVADLLGAVLRVTPASGGDEARTALDAAASGLTPRPLPCLLGPAQTAVWAADPRDGLGCRPLLEPAAMLAPLLEAARTGAFARAITAAAGRAGAAEAGLLTAGASLAAERYCLPSTLGEALAAAQDGEEARSLARELSLRRAVAHFVPAGRPDTAEPWLPLSGHCSPITCVAASARFGRVVACDASGRVSIHCVRAGRLVASCVPEWGLVGPGSATARKGMSCPVQCVGISRGGVIVLGHGRRVTAMDLSGRTIASARFEAAIVAAIASASGRFVLAATRQRIFVLHAATLTEAAVVEPTPPAPVRSLALSPSGRAVIAGFDRGLVGVYATDLTFYAAV